jgi:hypothetical protein
MRHAALVMLLLGVGRSGSKPVREKQLFVAFSQCNNAEPYRAAQNALMTKLFGEAEVLRAQPSIDVVYGHNDPMAIGAYLAAKELGRDKDMIFVGVDGLGGPAGGIKKVMDGRVSSVRG